MLTALVTRGQEAKDGKLCGPGCFGHAKVHAADCATCETRVGRIDHIERAIEISGPSMRSNAIASWRSPRSVPCIALHAEVSVVSQLVG